MPARRTIVVVLLALSGATLACASARSPATTLDASTTTARGCPTTAAASTIPATAAGPVRDPAVALREICAMMQHSAARWNAGDLAGFMDDYMPGQGTTYIGRHGVVRGPEQIRAGYAPRFGPGGVHDSLSFEDVEVDLLAPDLTNTIAYYVLMRGDSLIARGPTSLVMRRAAGRWRIIHDHSS
ncbi:MAG TPA: nuclear transport factor 2 family protein [Gemmatimonadaceae bacterium]|nr:nuclear transport factor 2 family protein [Gemmatimonadaceae bacterium]